MYIQYQNVAKKMNRMKAVLACSDISKAENM